jgi:hypothetical protein
MALWAWAVLSSAMIISSFDFGSLSHLHVARIQARKANPNCYVLKDLSL